MALEQTPFPRWLRGDAMPGPLGGARHSVEAHALRRESSVAPASPRRQMLPSFDGCLATGIVGVLLALLHGGPYRAALFYIGVPVVAIQLAVTRAANVSFVSFVAMLGAELIAWGLFGLPHSRLPRRHRAPTRHRAPPRAQEIPS